MPASPLYDRLTDVAQLDYSDPDAGMITNIQTQITSLREACTTFSQNLGVQGATRAALEQRVSDLQPQLDVLETRLQTVNNAHTEDNTRDAQSRPSHRTRSQDGRNGLLTRISDICKRRRRSPSESRSATQYAARSGCTGSVGHYECRRDNGFLWFYKRGRRGQGSRGPKYR